jgi:hypothetical protein
MQRLVLFFADLFRRSQLFEKAGFKYGVNQPSLTLRLAKAEREGFEPPEACTSTVFKTAAFDRSAISPAQKYSLKLYNTKNFGISIKFDPFLFEKEPHI